MMKFQLWLALGILAFASQAKAEASRKPIPCSYVKYGISSYNISNENGIIKNNKNLNDRDGHVNITTKISGNGVLVAIYSHSFFIQNEYDLNEKIISYNNLNSQKLIFARKIGNKDYKNSIYDITTLFPEDGIIKLNKKNMNFYEMSNYIDVEPLTFQVCFEDK